MKLNVPSCAAILMPLLLAACGSSHDNEPAAPAAAKVSVTELAAGVYAVGSGDAAAPTVGKYYAAADGARLLLLNNSAQQAGALYRRDAGSSATWQMTPAPTQDTKLDLLNSNAIPSTVVNIASVARSYSVRLASGAAAAFSINSSGDIVAGATNCKLSGKLTASSLPNALKASLTASGCGDLPAQSEGYLVVDGDYSPAVFRLLTYSGNTLVDLWSYAE
jgi:hypothetical protein